MKFAPGAHIPRQTVAELRAILDPEVKRRVAVGTAFSAVVACLEAGALVLVYPLVLTITALDDTTIPRSARWLARLVGSSDPSRLALLTAVAAVVIFTAKSVIGVAYTRWSFRLLTTAEAESRARLFGRYLRAPYAYHLEHNSAELHRTLSDAHQRVYREVLAYFMTGVAECLVLTAVCAVLIVVQPLAAGVAIGFFVAVGVGYQRLLHSRTYEAGAALHTGLAVSRQIIQQTLSSSKDLAVLGRQEAFEKRLLDNELRLAPRQATVILLSYLPRYYLELSLIVGVAAMSTFAFAVYESSQAIAVLGLFLAAGFRSLPSLNRLLVALSMIRSGAPSISQIYNDFTDLAPEKASATQTSGSQRLRVAPGIELRNVQFSYPERREPALVDVSIVIEPGEMIGIVGASGSGKTTLIDAVLGLIVPDRGEVLLNGFQLHEVDRSAIGYVPQHVSLLDDTLAENVAFGAPRETSRLNNAVERSELEDLVSALPLGLETPIGEGGSRLSGGQRQRVGIARAVYHDPVLLVLDEATSALDVETESRLAATIESMRNEITMLVVAHRLSTVRSCDRLLVMESGRIVDAGSFDELAMSSPGFRRLLEFGQVEDPVRSRTSTAAGAGPPDHNLEI